MYKKILLIVASFSSLGVFASGGTNETTTAFAKQQTRTTEDITRFTQQQTIAQQQTTDAINTLRNLLEKQGIVGKELLTVTKSTRNIHETSKSVAYSMVLDLKPYEVIGKIKAYYAFESKNELLHRGHAILIKTGCIGENYFGETASPSIEAIASSAEKIIALYEAKTLVERYEQTKNSR